MKPRAQEETSDMPDLTPMIDIVFLLSVFFMTVANMQGQQMVPIQMPIAESATVPDDRAGRIIITLKPDGNLFVGPMLIALEELPAYIAQAKSSIAQLKVYVRADAQVPLKQVREVFAASAEGGVPNVIFATHQSDK